MDKKKSAEKKRLYLAIARAVQEIARPYIQQGGHSLISIYFNVILPILPLCINTYRKMMKEDVSNLPQLMVAYREKAINQYLNRLRKQSRKRIKNKNQDSNRKKS